MKKNTSISEKRQQLVIETTSGNPNYELQAVITPSRFAIIKP